MNNQSCLLVSNFQNLASACENCGPDFWCGIFYTSATRTYEMFTAMGVAEWDRDNSEMSWLSALIQSKLCANYSQK